MTYQLVLYLHILTATLLMGGTVASHIARRYIARVSELSSLRGALVVVRLISRANPALAIALLASGATLGQVGFWRSAWFWVAFATWIANLVLAAWVVNPAIRRLDTAASAAGEGAPPPAVDAVRRATMPMRAHSAMIGLDLGTLAVMVLKPDLAASLLWPLGSAALVLIADRVADAWNGRRAAALGIA